MANSKAPFPLDDLNLPDETLDGYDHRIDLPWLISQGFDWFIADDAERLVKEWQAEGKRNIAHLLG